MKARSQHLALGGTNNFYLYDYYIVSVWNVYIYNTNALVVWNLLLSFPTVISHLIVFSRTTFFDVVASVWDHWCHPWWRVAFVNALRSNFSHQIVRMQGVSMYDFWIVNATCNTTCLFRFRPFLLFIFVELLDVKLWSVEHECGCSAEEMRTAASYIVHMYHVFLLINMCSTCL